MLSGEIVNIFIPYAIIHIHSNMPNPLNLNLQTELKKQGVDFIHFIDISSLSGAQTKGYSSAILFGIALSKDYLKAVSSTPNYIEQIKRMNQIHQDEFHLTELKTDRIADETAKYIRQMEFKAYSQSEDNIEKTGYYNQQTKSTPLPHKTLAGLAGLGWIGKHNLLVTPDYGSAISMCSILTDAPLATAIKEPMDSKCGSCSICVETCSVNALQGKSWNYMRTRDELIDVDLCAPCYRCVVSCPWTQQYLNSI